jgi:tRNA pseudouridine38-40 synthase
MKSIIESRDRNLSGKTLAASGLYFIGPEYPSEFKIKKPPVKHSVLPS